MTDEELKELVASLAIDSQRIKEQSAEDTANLKKQIEATDKQIKKTTRELGKQIRGLANKFGSFTEGLALPSMQTILQNQFKMEIVTPSVRAKKGEKQLEIDVLAYANSAINEVYVVEVKSPLREEGIDQLSTTIEQFRFFFPEHNEKKLFGILAAVEMSDSLKQKVLDKGFYAAKISDEVFSLDVPIQFQPKVF